MNITAKYLTKVYNNGTYALDGFTAEIKSGETVSVLGASGCGKTTLLRLLAGLEKPTAGELYFDGVLFKDLPIKQRDTAVVFQEYVLYPKMTVWENVAVALERYGLTREEEEKRVYKALNEFGLIKFRNQLPRVLSGGQQQRVALARAVVRNPSLILFDEPLSNIAPEQRADYMDFIKEMKARLPLSTFIYVTHNPREAMSIGDKLLIMGDGRCLQYGEKRRVWENPYCADVLRTICAETEEYYGEIKNGVFTAESKNDGIFSAAAFAAEEEDGGSAELKTFAFETDYCGAATVILNPYDKNKPCLFGVDGELLCGERRTAFLTGAFDGKILSFAGAEYAADEDFRLRFIGKYGKVTVGIESAKMRFNPLFGDVKIPAEICGNKLKIGGEEIFLYDTADFGGYVYVNPQDIALYNGKKRVLAHYRVYKQTCAAKAAGGMLRLPCGTVLYRGTAVGGVNVSFNEKAFIAPVKKGGIKAACLAEEDLGGVKLVYLALKGFGHYVTFYAKPKEKFFSQKKLKIAVAEEGVTVTKPLR